jgi:hypothetical protein
MFLGRWEAKASGRQNQLIFYIVWEMFVYCAKKGRRIFGSKDEKKCFWLHTMKDLLMTTSLLAYMK